MAMRGKARVRIVRESLGQAWQEGSMDLHMFIPEVQILEKIVGPVGGVRKVAGKRPGKERVNSVGGRPVKSRRIFRVKTAFEG